MTMQRIESGHSKFRPLRFERLAVVLCLLIASLSALDIALSLGDPEDFYLENRTDPLVFRAVGNLLREGQSPYPLDNLVTNISDTEFAGEQPPSLTSVNFPPQSLDFYTVRAMTQRYGEQAITAIPFSYPPNSLPFFWLRSVGDPELNAAIQMAIAVFLSMLTLSILLYRYIDNHITRLVILLIAMLWNPAMLDLLLTQTGHLVAALIFSIVIFHDRRPLLAGLFLGLLAFKPQYAIPLGLVSLTRQNWPLLTSALATFVASCLVSGIAFGWGMWLQFWENASSLNITLFHMESWLGIMAIAFPDTIDLLSALALPVYGTGMAILGTALYLLRERLDLLWAVSLAITVTVIVSPNTHPYDVNIFLLPVICLCRYFGMKLWFAVITLTVFIWPNVLVSISATRFGFLIACLLLLTGIIWRELRRPTSNLMPQGVMMYPASDLREQRIS